MNGFSAVILAGGRSTRFGSDKACHRIGGQTLLQRQAALLSTLGPASLMISCRPEQGFSEPGCVPLHDTEPGQGPLHGMVRALSVSDRPLLLVLAVDMPQIDRSLLESLLQASRSGRGAVFHHRFFEPLCAVYPREALPFLEESLRSGHRRLQDICEHLVNLGLMNVLVPSAPERDRLANLNELAQDHDGIKS